MQIKVIEVSGVPLVIKHISGASEPMRVQRSYAN